MLKLKLIRFNKTSSFTEGVLVSVHDNGVLCDTLEDVIRDVNGDGDLNDEYEWKVYGETAIPYSPKSKPYKIKVTYSPRFNKNMVLVCDVDGFSGIRMHYGKTKNNTDGCILMGKKISNGVLSDTGMTDILVNMLRENDNDGTLEIV